ncbi:MAG: immunoglobulin domain-containing protein, partial [Verrucomicrobiota bacterium]
MKTNFLRRGSNNQFFNCLPFAIVGFLLAAFPARASVIGWGTNEYGQLTIPINLISAKAVSAGYWHGLAITVSNRVVSWGLNDLGQTNVPLGLTNVAAVAAGNSHSLALRADGSLVAWGVSSNDYNPNPYLNFYFGQTDLPANLTNATAIAAGAFHSLALKTDGTVQAWGYDFYGQCDVPAGLSNVVAIAAGGYFSVALKSDGTVAAWGDNYYGQTNLPPDLTNVVAIAAGGVHGLALKADGTVAGWGARGLTDYTSDFGQANPPANLTNVTMIAAGFYHSLALLNDGTVRQWGDTSLGQTNPPARLNRVLAVAGGYAYSYALTDDHPLLLTQPTNVMTATSKTATFAVQASGALPLRASWYRTGLTTNLGSVVLSNTTVSASFTGGSVQGIPVNTTNQLPIQFSLNLLATYSALTNVSTNTFYLVITNSLGSVTSSVASLTVLLPPKITNQPVNVATNLGATVFFTVGASGSQPLGYQWFFNGTNNPVGVNSNVLELDNVDTNNAGNYTV